MADTINRQKVLAEFEKKEKDLAEDVNTIKEWLKTQPHLPETPSDNMIEHFIVNNKFSLEQTKTKLDMYYTIRTQIPGIYTYSNPKSYQMKVAEDAMYAFNIPKFVDGLYPVNFIKLKSDIPHDLDVNYVIAESFVNCLEIRLQQDVSLGLLIIIDFENLKMEHIIRITTMHLKYTAAILEMFSNRVKAFHIINHPQLFDVLLKMCRPFFKKKLLNRLQLHSSYESLAQYIPLDILPQDYGGKGKSIADLQEDWNKTLGEYSDRFDKLDTLKVNESLRPTPMEDIEAFGIPGTFKKQDVD